MHSGKHRKAELRHKGSDDRAKQCVEHTQLILWMLLQTQQVVNKYVFVGVQFYVCGWEIQLFYDIFSFLFFVIINSHETAISMTMKQRFLSMCVP